MRLFAFLILAATVASPMTSHAAKTPCGSYFSSPKKVYSEPTPHHDHVEVLVDSPYLDYNYRRSEARLIGNDPAVQAFLAKSGIIEVRIIQLKYGREFGGYYSNLTAVEFYCKRNDGTQHTAGDFASTFYVSMRSSPRVGDHSRYSVSNSSFGPFEQ